MNEKCVFIMLARLMIWTLVMVRYAKSAPGSSCNGRWQAYSHCMRQEQVKRNDPITGLPRPTTSKLENIQTSFIRSCFTDNHCKDPLAPEAHSRAVGVCFPMALKISRKDLEDCVKKNMSNFYLPDDQYSMADGVYSILLLSASTAMQNIDKYCPSSVTPKLISSCLSQKWHSSNFTTPSPSGPSNCHIVNQCKSISMTTSCNSMWNELLCPCTLSTISSSAPAKYIDCMKEIGVTVDTQNDVALAWLSQSVQGWCGSTGWTGSNWSPGLSDICNEISSETSPTTVPPFPNDPETSTSGPTVETTSPLSNGLPDTATIPSSESSQDTTQFTYFFEHFTFPAQVEESTTTPISTQKITTKSNVPRLLQNIGIGNPLEGFVHDWDWLLKGPDGWKNKTGLGK